MIVSCTPVSVTTVEVPAKRRGGLAIADTERRVDPLWMNFHHGRRHSHLYDGSPIRMTAVPFGRRQSHSYDDGNPIAVAVATIVAVADLTTPVDRSS